MTTPLRQRLVLEDLARTSSWGGALGAQLDLKHDAYRITIGGGGGEFKLQLSRTRFSGWQRAGVRNPLSQRPRAFLIESKLRLLHDWYAGSRYHLNSNYVSLNSTKFDPNDLLIPPSAGN